jgi:hypothetical protein
MSEKCLRDRRIQGFHVIIPSAAIYRGLQGAAPLIDVAHRNRSCSRCSGVVKFPLYKMEPSENPGHGRRHAGSALPTGAARGGVRQTSVSLPDAYRSVAEQSIDSIRLQKSEVIARELFKVKAWESMKDLLDVIREAGGLIGIIFPHPHMPLGYRSSTSVIWI